MFAGGNSHPGPRRGRGDDHVQRGGFLRAGPIAFMLLLAGTLVILSVTLFSPSASEQHSPQFHRGLLAARTSHYADKVLLGSHNRVLWLDLRSGKTRVLTEGNGVYHGIIAGDPDPSNGKPRTIWVLSRPHNWKATTSIEALLKFSAVTGFQLDRVEVPTKFAHDLQRIGDKAYVVSTGDGSILEYSLPHMKQTDEMQKIFTLHEHINTLNACDDGNLWVMKHMLGPSEIVKINRQGEVLQTFKGVGQKAHGLGLWKEFIVVLDSDNAAINLVHNTTGSVKRIFKLDEVAFLKGLVILGGKAVFGINQHAPRSARNDVEMDAEVGILDLESHQLLSRLPVPTKGLLNIIVSPEKWRSLPALAGDAYDTGSEAAGEVNSQNAAVKCVELSNNDCRSSPYCVLSSKTEGTTKSVSCGVCTAPPCTSKGGNHRPARKSKQKRRTSAADRESAS